MGVRLRAHIIAQPERNYYQIMQIIPDRKMPWLGRALRKFSDQHTNYAAWIRKKLSGDIDATQQLHVFVNQQ